MLKLLLNVKKPCFNLFGINKMFPGSWTPNAIVTFYVPYLQLHRGIRNRWYIRNLLLDNCQKISLQLKDISIFLDIGGIWQNCLILTEILNIYPEKVILLLYVILAFVKYTYCRYQIITFLIFFFVNLSREYKRIVLYVLIFPSLIILEVTYLSSFRVSIIF